jgi:hypothetical protein
MHLGVRLVVASPSHVHGIVLVAPSRSRPLRAAMRWRSASLDIATTTRSAAGRGDGRGISCWLVGLVPVTGGLIHRAVACFSVAWTRMLW